MPKEKPRYKVIDEMEDNMNKDYLSFISSTFNEMNDSIKVKDNVQYKPNKGIKQYH